MIEMLPPGARYRHVVFPDPPPWAGGATYGPVAREQDAGAAADETPFDVEERDFLRWLFESAGLEMTDYKPETLRRRLPACLRAVRAPSVRHARRIMDGGGDGAAALRATALGTLVIGVTHFFRDDATFACLANDRIIEALAADAGAAGRPLRIWSAGCSDGAELYSVAMLLAERGLLQSCELIGTDCRRDAIARACAGAFDDQAVRAVPADLLARYFVNSAGRRGLRAWQIDPRLRSAVRWRVASVLADADANADQAADAADADAAGEADRWDLVLCRNLAIYLQPDAAGRLWRRLAAAVRPGGVLVLGKAERPTGVRGLEPIGPCLFRRAVTEHVT